MAAPVPAPADQSWLATTCVRTVGGMRMAATGVLACGRRRLPGVAQAAGVAAIVAGVVVLAGLGVGLIVGGVLAVGLGVLFEREA